MQCLALFQAARPNYRNFVAYARDPHPGHPLHRLKSVPYAAKRLGATECRLGELLDAHSEDCKNEIRQLMAGPAVPIQSENSP